MTEEKQNQDEKKQEETQPSPVAPQEEKESPKEDQATTESKKEVKVPAKFKSLVDEIEKMNVMDLSELVKILEDKFGVSAQAPMAVAAAPAGGDSEDAGAREEQTTFNVELTEAGGNKISVIKAIREFITIGLKEAKDLVDAAPKLVKEGVNKEEAENMKKRLEEAGGKVTLK